MGVLRAAQDNDQPAGDGGENGEGQAARGELEPLVVQKDRIFGKFEMSNKLIYHINTF